MPRNPAPRRTASRTDHDFDGVCQDIQQGRQAVPAGHGLHAVSPSAYHWTIVAGDGATLARSTSFASYDDAEKAAKHVRDGAASARFERRAGEQSRLISLRVAMLRATTPTPSGGLDEGGSFSSEAVAKWPEPR